MFQGAERDRGFDVSELVDEQNHNYAFWLVAFLFDFGIDEISGYFYRQASVTLTLFDLFNSLFSASLFYISEK